MHYTSDEIALIDGVIATLYPRMSDQSLRNAYLDVYRRLEDNALDAADLQRIANALELADPGQCVSFHKEPYRDFIELRVKTHTMLNSNGQATGKVKK